MDWVWSFLAIFSINRPSYTTVENHPTRSKTLRGDRNAPVITSYRLLVSGTAVTFGITKAALSYQGFETQAGWMDWTLGAFLSSMQVKKLLELYECILISELSLSFYLLGLYELNSIGSYPGFFATDRSYLILGKYSRRYHSYRLLSPPFATS